MWSLIGVLKTGHMPFLLHAYHRILLFIIMGFVKINEHLKIYSFYPFSAIEIVLVLLLVLTYEPIPVTRSSDDQEAIITHCYHCACAADRTGHETYHSSLRNICWLWI